jgi:DNA polymerase II small subunit
MMAPSKRSSLHWVILVTTESALQSQTTFQKQMNVNPTPALAVVVDLQTLVPETFSFL